MISGSTTIRVSVTQRQRLRELAAERSATMTETLDAALEALRRDQFHRWMASAEPDLRSDPAARAEYVGERNARLGADLG